MNAGDTFFGDTGRGESLHLWIVVSDPGAEQVMLANFTTFRGRNVHHDPACVVEKTEHQFLSHKSWIKYQDSLLVSGKALGKAQGNLRLHKPISAALLKRIRQGAVDSEFTPLKCRQLILDQGFATEEPV